MKFLTKFGQIVLKGIQIVTGFAPMVAAMTPTTKDDKIVAELLPDLAQIAEIIAQVEVFGQALNLPGTQKLIAASPAVAQIVLRSSVLANHTIADEALFTKGCNQIAAGMADVLNSLKDDIEMENKKA